LSIHALPEQVVRDCRRRSLSKCRATLFRATRIVLQREVAPAILRMLEGAARELELGDPWSAATDIGPLIDAARCRTSAHIARPRGCRQAAVPPALAASCAAGSFAAPAAFRLADFRELPREVFGPVCT